MKLCINYVIDSIFYFKSRSNTEPKIQYKFKLNRNLIHPNYSQNLVPILEPITP